MFRLYVDTKELSICNIENKLPIKINSDLNTEDILNTQVAEGLVGFYQDHGQGRLLQTDITKFDQARTFQDQVRLDSSVNFSWGTGSPIDDVGGDYFDIVWQGALSTQGLSDGSYTFAISRDDFAIFQ